MKTIVISTVAIVMLVVLSIPTAHAGTMAPYWSNSYGDFGVDVGNSIAVDGAGAAYVAGSFSDVMTLGALELEAVVVQNLFVAKVSDSGAFVWAQTTGGVDVDLHEALAKNEPGDRVSLSVSRRGSEMQITVTLGAAREHMKLRELHVSPVGDHMLHKQEFDEQKAKQMADANWQAMNQ